MIETTKATGDGARAPTALGWSGRPATGRSFVTMMVLGLIATGVALFLAFRPTPGRARRESAAKLSSSRPVVP